MRVTGILLFLILLCNLTQAQTVFTTTASSAWDNPAIWDCGGCGFYPGEMADNDRVIIQHNVILEGGITLIVGDVTINNAILEIRGVGGNPNLTTNNIVINSSGTGTAALQILRGEPVLSINGNLTINRNTAASGSSALTQFRFGGSNVEVTKSSVSITGNLNYNYLSGSLATSETSLEVSIGNSSSFIDDCSLLIGGDINLTYNFNNINPNNVLAFEVGNSSSVTANNLNMTITESGTASGADMRFAVLGTSGAKVTILNNVTMLFNDGTFPNSGSDLYLRSGDDNVDNQNTSIEIGGNLNMISNFSTGGNNTHVRVSGTSEIKIGGDLSFSATLATGRDIENRFTIYDQGKIILKKSIINPLQGSFNFNFASDSNGKIEFSGNVPQNFPRRLVSTNFKNVIINNTSGFPFLIEETTLNIKSNLQMLNGIIRSSTSNILVFEDGATSNGGNENSYINGPVRKRGGTLNNNIILPLGSTNKWAPMEISNITGANGSTLITARYFNTSYVPLTTDGTFSHVSKKEYWDLSVTGLVPTVDLTLHWKDACFSDILSVTGPPSQDLFVGRFNSGTSKWNLLSASTINPGSNSCDNAPYTGGLKVTGVNSFNAFTIVSSLGVSLPIKLNDFRVEPYTNGQAKIIWITDFEESTSHYFIQRMSPEKSENFETLGKVMAAENSKVQISYEFIDNQPQLGDNYYRLVQVDADGTETIFEPVNFKFSQPGSLFVLYPNPVINDDYIELYDNSEDEIALIQFKVISAEGIDVSHKWKIEKQTDRKFRLYFSDLENGIYTIQLFSSNGTSFHKVVIYK